MAYFLQQLINGIALGSIYGLIAIGYTMVYGIIGMINFAHGDIFMVGAFIALIAFLLLDEPRADHGPARPRPRADRRHGADRGMGLDGRAHRLPAVARVLPARAADHRHRHVDRAAEFHPGVARRAGEAAPARGHRRLRAVPARRFRGHPVQHPDSHRGDDARADDGVLAGHRPHAARPGAARLRAGPAHGRRCPASMSTAPSRSPSCSARHSRPSPGCSTSSITG